MGLFSFFTSKGRSPHDPVNRDDPARGDRLRGDRLGQPGRAAVHRTLFQDFYRSLLLPSHDRLAGVQESRDDRFSILVSQSPLRLWSPGDPIPQQGDWLLIGVATWSAYDMRLLDAVSQALADHPSLAIGVFDVADCLSETAFERYVPGLGQVFHTPIAGHWRDGNLVEKASGRAGRQLIARLGGLDPVAVEQLQHPPAGSNRS